MDQSWIFPQTWSCLSFISSTQSGFWPTKKWTKLSVSQAASGGPSWANFSMCHAFCCRTPSFRWGFCGGSDMIWWELFNICWGFWWKLMDFLMDLMMKLWRSRACKKPATSKHRFWQVPRAMQRSIPERFLHDPHYQWVAKTLVPCSSHQNVCVWMDVIDVHPPNFVVFCGLSENSTLYPPNPHGLKPPKMPYDFMALGLDISINIPVVKT